MVLLVLLGALVWCAVMGIILMFVGWLWTGLIMLVVPIVIIWFIWNASL